MFVSFPGNEFADEVSRVISMYPPEVAASQLNLLDSHDMPRFLTCCGGDKDALKLAWLFVCILPGAPCIYYGDEVGLDGRHDPDCRKGFPWDEAVWDHDLMSWYRQCISIRRDSCSAIRVFPKAVAADTSKAIVFLNEGQTPTISAFNVGNENQQVTVDAGLVAERRVALQLTEQAALSVVEDQLVLNLPARSAMVVV